MSFTEKQRAYHFQKMKTRLTRLDINKDGYISREDYDLMSKRLAERSGMTKEQAEQTHKELMKVADRLELKPGVKLPVLEAAKKASEWTLSITPEEQKVNMKSSHNLLFDVIDTNKDGHISTKEFGDYFYTIAPDLTEAEVVYSFNTIDANKNGEISREEFMAAAEDFFCGVEETELSKVFFGKLLD